MMAANDNLNGPVGLCWKECPVTGAHSFTFDPECADTDPADVFAHLLRIGFRCSNSAHAALALLSADPRAPWAIPLRDALDAQFRAEAEDFIDLVESFERAEGTV